MTGPRARPPLGARAAVFAGWLAGFVALVDLVRLVRLPLLTDPDPSWAAARLVLGLAVASASAAGGVAVTALVFAARRSPAFVKPLEALPFGAKGAGALALAALGAGAVLRLVALERVPEWLWIDDVSLIEPALALQARWTDFADSIRSVPFGVTRLYGTVGVLYLEGYRLALQLWGTTVFGVRFPSALAGVVSLVTGGLLGRALLPRGGGALAVLALAGLRWHLILSRWGWVMIVLAPIVDLATLLLLRARRRGSPAFAAAGGIVAGLGAHVYLSAWVAAAGLGAFALWPSSAGSLDAPAGQRRPPRGESLRLALLFALGFAAAAAPIFLFRDGRAVSYFARTSDHNLALEIARNRSVLPALAAAADALAAPWLLSDPSPRQDLPGASRLGWLLGVPVAVALTRSLFQPRDELPAWLLSHAGAAFAATVAGGQAGVPNGSRFGYLTTVTAVAAAAGVMALLRLAPAPRRRTAARAAVGLLALAGGLGARDALRVWPERPETFSGFHGIDTMIGRAAARWEEFGHVEVAKSLGHSAVMIGAVRRYRLDQDRAPAPAGAPRLRIRIIAPGPAAGGGERVVEHVRDPEGRPLAVVLARR